MAEQRQARRRVGVFDGVEEWMRQRNADVMRLGHEAEAAGRGVWNQATRTGHNLAATRPSDVVALGARVLASPRTRGAAPIQVGAAPVARRPAPSAPPRMPAAKSLGQEASDQVLAGARGAQDAFTFGAGDHLYAGALALGDAARGADLRGAYEGRIAAERKRDRYDAEHYRTARAVGQVIGTGAQVAALGPAEGLVAGGARIAEASPEIAVLGGAGAAAGVGGQAISDVSRGKVGSVGDYVGAGLGGTVGALASRGGRAGYAGAAAGAATSLAQDLLNGRVPSVDKARSAALAGGVMGTAGGMLGRSWSDELPIKAKELIGERFSRLRTWARGDETRVGPKSREYLEEGGYTVPDQRTYRGSTPRDIVESKFGRKAALSRRQRQAYEQPLSNYRVDHSLPRDPGVLIGFPLAEYGYDRAREDLRW